jgi:hypothetical protein
VNLTREDRIKGGKTAGQTHKRKAYEFAMPFKSVLESYPAGRSYYSIAQSFNKHGIKKTRSIGPWRSEHIKRIAERLGITHLGCSPKN